MAKGVKFGGKIDEDYWKKQISKVKTAADARTVLQDIMEASYMGTFNIGVSDKDQKTINNLIKSLGTKMGIDTKKLSDIWDPKINALRSTNVESAIQRSLTLWDDSVNNKQLTESAKEATKASETANNTSTTGSSTSTSSSTPTGGSSNAGLNSLVQQYLQQNKNLQAKIDALENPKVWTSDELANLYGVTDQYNYNNILNRYNNATEQYYTDAIKTQQENNRVAEASNAVYANRLLNAYLNGYANAAPTAIGKGTLAANALSTMLGTSDANETAATSLENLIEEYRRQREADLATNAINARNEYNTLGSYLLTQGANMNRSDVTNYINTLKANETEYAANANAISTLVRDAAQVYEKNANAAIAKNAANNSFDNMFKKRVQEYYGPGWETAYRNILNDNYTKYANGETVN